MRGAHGLEADVWSVGVMFYTMLVGRPPFDTEGVRNTLNKVCMYECLPDILLEILAKWMCSLAEMFPVGA